MTKFEYLFRFIWHASEARDIKKDPAKRASCKKFGAISSGYAVSAVLLTLLAVLSLDWMKGEGALLFIFIAVLLIASALGALVTVLNAVAYWFLQLSVNRRAMTWISLAILLASIAGIAFIALTMI